MVYPDGRVTDCGEIVEIEQQKRIVIRWRNEFRPELKAEGYSQCTMEIELIEVVSGGWPKILSNLKSLLEAGSALPEFAAQVK